MTDDAAGDVEAEARALAHIFRREEGIEDAIEDVLRNSGTIVDHPHAYLALGCAGFDPDVTFWRRVDGVVQEIGPHLIELAAVAFDRWQSRRDLHGHLDRIRAGFWLHHRHRVGEAASNLDWLQRGFLVDVGEALHRGDERVDTRGGGIDLRRQLPDGELLREIFE